MRGSPSGSSSPSGRTSLVQGAVRPDAVRHGAQVGGRSLEQATLQLLADRLGVLVADIVIDPDGSDRERVLEATRKLPAGALKKLARELSQAKTKRAR